MGKPSSTRRPEGLQILRNGSRVKPRIIHTRSPKVFKIKPEQFLELVQKLTGRSDSEATEVEAGSTISTEIGFFRKLAKQQDNVDISSSYSHPPLDELKGDSMAFVGTPVSTQLLASLPSPRFMTMNFLPILAASPSVFCFPSAAY